MADATLLEPPRPHFDGSPSHRYNSTTARPVRLALALGLVHLVQVVLEPGKQTCPPLASPDLTAIGVVRVEIEIARFLFGRDVGIHQFCRFDNAQKRYYHVSREAASMNLIGLQV
jgi:hypothetical protein